jgi:hypothetical protein
MTDFLTRLVQRQLGDIPSIEPRIPELYAPVVAAMPLFTTEEIAAEPSDSRSITGAPALVDDANPTQNPTSVLVEIRQREPARADIAAESKVSRRKEEPVAEPFIENGSSEGNVSSEVAPLVTPQAAAVPKAAPSLPPITNPASLSRGAKPEQRVSISAMVGTPVPQFFVTREAEAPLARPEQVRPMAPPPRLEFKKSGRGEVPAREHAHADSEPPVQVTIGRIEVTAMTAAPVPRRPAAARKPAMSLDDYLARRQRGER